MRGRTALRSQAVPVQTSSEGGARGSSARPHILSRGNPVSSSAEDLPSSERCHRVRTPRIHRPHVGAMPPFLPPLWPPLSPAGVRTAQSLASPAPFPMAGHCREGGSHLGGLSSPQKCQQMLRVPTVICQCPASSPCTTCGLLHHRRFHPSLPPQVLHSEGRIWETSPAPTEAPLFLLPAPFVPPDSTHSWASNEKPRAPPALPALLPSTQPGPGSVWGRSWGREAGDNRRK